MRISERVTAAARKLGLGKQYQINLLIWYKNPKSMRFISGPVTITRHGYVFTIAMCEGATHSTVTWPNVKKVTVVQPTILKVDLKDLRGLFTGHRSNVRRNAAGVFAGHFKWSVSSVQKILEQVFA